MEKILTGTDRARELGFKSYREWILALAEKNGHAWDGKSMSDSAVYARIDFGRWLADCEMGHASYVEPSDAFFYCYMCGNEPAEHGKGRPVIFPENRKEIEKEILKRTVKLSVGLPGKLKGEATQVAMNSHGAANSMLTRSWKPGETVVTLKGQRLAAHASETRVSEVADDGLKPSRLREVD